MMMMMMQGIGQDTSNAPLVKGVAQRTAARLQLQRRPKKWSWCSSEVLQTQTACIRGQTFFLNSEAGDGRENDSTGWPAVAMGEGLDMAGRMVV